MAALAGACSSSTKPATSTAPKSDSDPKALAVCHGRTGYDDSSFVLRAAYTATVADVIAWSNSGNPPNWGTVIPSFEQGRASDELLSVCWLDGPFTVSTPPGTAAFNRAMVVIDAKGKTWLQSAGYQRATARGAVPLRIRRPSAGAGDDRPDGATGHVTVSPTSGPVGTLVHFEGDVVLSFVDFYRTSGGQGLWGVAPPDCAILVNFERFNMDVTDAGHIAGSFVVSKTLNGCNMNPDETPPATVPPGVYEVTLASHCCPEAEFRITPST